MIYFYYIYNIDNNVPAPNSYKVKTLMGTIYNSKYRSGNLISMSPKFKYKDSREQFEIRTHKRLIEIIGPSAKTIDALSRLELPSGVDIEIKL